MSTNVCKYRQILNNVDKYQQMLTYVDKCRIISTNIDKYRHLSTNIDKIDKYRNLSTVIDIPCQSASAGSTSAKKISHRGSLDGKFVSVFLGQICLALSFFFLVSWLNSFLGQKFQMRRGAQTGGMKKFWEFFFDFSKKFGNTSIRKIMQKTFFQFSLQFTHHHSRFSQLCQVQNGGIPI